MQGVTTKSSGGPHSEKWKARERGEEHKGFAKFGVIRAKKKEASTEQTKKKRFFKKDDAGERQCLIDKNRQSSKEGT